MRILAAAEKHVFDILADSAAGTQVVAWSRQASKEAQGPDAIPEWSRFN